MVLVMLSTFSIHLQRNVLANRPLSPDAQIIRDDAIVLMAGALLPQIVAAYCQANVEENRTLDDAAERWSVRHEPIFGRLITAVEQTGGVPSGFRQEVNANVKAQIENQDDQISFCRSIPSLIESGAFDLDKRENMSDAYRRFENADKN